MGICRRWVFKKGTGDMGQAEILEVLEKNKKPMSRTQIAKEIKKDPIPVSKSIRKLLKNNEVKCIELDRHQAAKYLNMNRPFRRMRFYYVG